MARPSTISMFEIDSDGDFWEDVRRAQRPFWKRCSICSMGPSERALWLMLAVNSSLTVVQLTCGALANSLSLIGDGALMGIDSVCYAVGIYAERLKVDTRAATKADRRGALFSIVMLALTTAWVFFDVVDRLTNDDDDEETTLTPRKKGASRVGSVTEVDGGQVNAMFMLIFTVINLLADACVAFACWKFGLVALVADPDDAPATKSGSNEPKRRPSSFEADHEVSRGKEGSENWNIFGAFAHLAADGVRGIAVLCAGSLAVAGVVDAAKADAYCSLFVCLFVLAAAASLLRTVLRRSNPTAYEHMDEDEVGRGGSIVGASPSEEITGGVASPSLRDPFQTTPQVFGQRTGLEAGFGNHDENPDGL